MENQPRHILMTANDTTFVYNLRRQVLQGLIDKGCKVTVMAQILNFGQELRAMGCEIVDIKTARQGKNPFKDLILFKKILPRAKRKSPRCHA